MSTATRAIQNLMVIDSQVSNWRNLASAAGNDTAVLILDANLDGLMQISDYLSTFAKSDANYIPLQSIQIFSHGSAGSLLLGSTTLNAANLKHYTSQLATLGNALTTTGDILLYGCNVAAEQIGLDFINQLSSLTNADVAASTDLTGSPLLGGNWQLESTTGPIESAAALNVNTLNNYNEVLLAPTLRNGVEDIPYTLTVSDLLLSFNDKTLNITSLSTDVGTAVDNGNSTYTITTDLNYNGDVTINCTLSDGATTSQVYNIIPVNDAPIRDTPPTVLVDGKEDTPFILNADFLLQDFSDIDNDKLSIISLTANHGSVTYSNGQYTITPEINFYGDNIVTYIVSDVLGDGSQLRSDPLTIQAIESYAITPVNDPPTLKPNPNPVTLTGKEDTDFNITQAIINQLLNNYVDVELDKLVIDSMDADQGTISITGSTFIYTPDPDFNGPVTLIYDIYDGTDTLTGIKQILNITAVNDAPVLSDTIDIASLDDGTINMPYIIKAIDLLQGYTDIEGDTLSVANLVTADHGKVNKDIKNGTYIVTPTKDYTGTVLVSYSISDGKVGGVLKAALPFDLNNHAPIITTPSAIQYNDTIYDDVFKLVTGKLDANDLDSDKLIYGIKDSIDNHDGTFSKNGSFGTLTINSASGDYSFAPKDSAIEALTKTQPKTDFTMTTSDGVVTINSILSINIISNTKSESIEDDILVGTDGNDKFDGLAGNDNITGKKGNDILNGGAGADILDGGYGNDTYYVDNSGDILVEYTGAGFDTVYSSISYSLKTNFENLTLSGTQNLNGTGNFLDNILTGNAGKNMLKGGEGNDVLNGGIGNDILTGGSGKDNFQLTNFSKDTFKDFSVKDDTIQLENSIFTKLGKSGSLNVANFKKGVAATDANDYVIYNQKTGILSYDADGNEPGAAIQIALISGHPALTIADFYVI